MKPTMFDERVANAIRKWHKSAKRKIKLQDARKSSSTNHPVPDTLANGSLSPVHLLRYYQSEAAARAESNSWEITDASSGSLPRHFHHGDGSDTKHNYELQTYLEGECLDKHAVVPGDCIIDVDLSSNDFSFDKRVNRWRFEYFTSLDAKLNASGICSALVLLWIVTSFQHWTGCNKKDRGVKILLNKWLAKNIKTT